MNVKINSQILVDELSCILFKYKNPNDAYLMEKYMRHNFKFLGIKKPIRTHVTKQWKTNVVKLHTLCIPELVLHMWENDEREFQYVAMDLMSDFINVAPISFINDIERLIVSKSWWDTVDLLASKISGRYFQLYPSKMYSITNKWCMSENIWLNRASLLFQLKYKETADLELLHKYFIHLSHSNDFFVQKAIGWILREYSKTNTAFVRQIINSIDLKPLSIREASKYLQ